MEKNKLSEYQKQYQEKNKEKKREIDRQYYIKNKEKNKEKKREYNKKYRENNKDKQKLYREKIKENQKEYFREYYKRNKDIIKKRSKQQKEEQNKEEQIRYHTQYYINNKEKWNKYRIKNIDKIRLNRRNSHNQRFQTDPLYKLTHNIRGLIHQSIKKMKISKTSKTTQILGCSFEDFKIHIESHFDSWMNWENYGRYNGKFNYGWDIDHIIPDSSGKTEEEIIKLNHYTNLQPLCSKINRDIKKDNIHYINN